MDADRFDTLSRTLTTPGPRRAALRAFGGAFSRRRLTGVLGGSGLGAVLGLMSRSRPVAAGCGKPCGPCKRCKGDRCRPKTDDTPCKGDGRCLKGRCKERPVCTAAGQACSSGNPGACCSGVCGSGMSPNCVRGETDTKCLTGGDCISGQCIGYRCQGTVDCATKPDGTLCATNRACHGGACVGCWTEVNDGCGSVQNDSVTVIRPAFCSANRCISCTADRWCEDRCLSAACSNHCYKRCSAASPCCSELTCQHMPEQDDPNRHLCAPA